MEVLVAILFALAGAATCFGMVQAFLALRAKWRAHKLLALKIADSAELRESVSKILHGKPSEADIEKAAGAISLALRPELSESDRRWVEAGLHQTNRKDELRYINAMIL